jgi:branched-chain amino acid transport system substrate-binding protein
MVIVIIGLWIIKRGQKEPEIYKIGSIVPLTGSAAEWGQNDMEGLGLAIAEANNALGPNEKKFQLIVEDSKSQPKEAITAFNKIMLTEKPEVIFTIQSGVSLTIAPLANQQRKILLASAAAPQLMNSGDYIFRRFPRSERLIEVLTEEAIKKLGIKEMYVIYINNDYGRSMRDVFVSKFRRDGGVIIGEDTFEESQLDFRSQVAKVISKKPKALFIPGSGTALGNLLRQLKQSKYSGTILTTLEVSYEDVLKVGRKAVEGVIYVDMSFDPNSTDPNMQGFLQKFRENYNHEPILDALIGYDTGKMVIEVIKRHGYNSDKIREGLLQVKNFHGILGNLSVSQNREIEYPLRLKTIKNGKVIFYE